MNRRKTVRMIYYIALLHPHPRPVLYCLCHMIGRNHVTPGKISNRSGQFQHPVKRPGRQMQLLHCGLQQLLGGRFDVAEVADLGGAHFGVTGQFGAGEALELALASGLNAGTDGGGVLNLALVGEFLVIDTGDFDVDVDAVEQGAADAFLVAGDGGGGTTALFDGVAVETAGTSVRVATTLLSNSHASTCQLEYFYKYTSSAF